MKKLLVSLTVCCGLSAQAQLSFVLSGSQAKIYGDGSGITNITGVTPYTNNNNAAGWIVGNGIGTNVVATSSDSYIFTNAAAGGLRFTNAFGLGAFVTGGTASFLTSTGLVTTVSAANTAVYGSQYILYAGVNGIDLATGFTLLDGTDNPALQPQSRALVGNWNAQGDLDVDGDLNVDGEMLVNNLIVTNFFTGLTNKLLSTDGNGQITNVMIGTGLDFSTNQLTATATGGSSVVFTNGAIIPVNENQYAAPASTVLTGFTSNTVYVRKILVPASLYTSNAVFRMGTANSVILMGLSLYSLDGNKLLDVTTGLGTTANNKTNLSTTAVITNGYYYQAWSVTGTATATMRMQSIDAGAWSFMDQSDPVFGIAANASVAGVNPSTLGTVSSNTPAAWPMFFFKN